MIASLQGKVTDKSGDAVVVEIGNIGYEVFVRAEDAGAIRVGDEAKFWIYEQLREDIHALYGFSDRSAQQLFELLLGVNGVGPKLAMAILSAASLDQLRSAIAAGDPELLRGISGVGQKTAQRIMLELNGKLTTGVESADSDATYQALLALGYNQAQAAGAVAKLPADVTGEQERIKLALQGLAK